MDHCELGTSGSYASSLNHSSVQILGEEAKQYLSGWRHEDQRLSRGQSQIWLTGNVYNINSQKTDWEKFVINSAIQGPVSKYALNLDCPVQPFCSTNRGLICLKGCAKSKSRTYTECVCVELCGLKPHCLWFRSLKMLSFPNIVSSLPSVLHIEMVASQWG